MEKLHIKKTIILLSSFIFLMFSQSFGQSASGDSEEYNRWSGSLHGGYIYAERDQGLQIFASRFNVPSDPSWAVGGDIRYALTPFWSIEGGYRFSFLEGNGFETDVHSISLKNSFHLNRLYRRNDLSEVLDPYLLLGLEQDIFTVEGPDEEFSRSEASIIGGLGIAFRVSERIELFAQHELKLSSNRLDLVDEGFPYDEIGMSSGGVRIHFGSSDKRPLNLKPAMRQLSDNEYDQLLARVEKVDELSERMESLETHVTERDRDHEEQFGELNNRVATLESRVDSLESKTESLDERVSDLERRIQAELERTETVAAGHYIQVYASLDFETAMDVKEQFIELLRGELDNPEEEVFIIQRKQFFEVLIGTFHEFSEAQRLLPEAVSAMPDAFVITFPRPVQLEEQYEGTAIVHNRGRN